MGVSANSVALFIDPFSYHFERDMLFEQTEKMNTEAEEIMAPYIHLRRWFADRGIGVHTADRLERREVGADVNILMSFGLQQRYKRLAKRNDVVLSAFFAFESPVVDPLMYERLPEIAERFKRVFSFSDSESLEPLTKRRLTLERFCLPYPIDMIREDVWRRDNRGGFLVMINHNKLPALHWNELYSKRPAAVEFFARYNEIDLYGRGWDTVPYQMGQTWKPATVQHIERFFKKQWQRFRPNPELEAARRVYKGSVPSKIQTLGNYTFCLCFDNVTLKGWITEKIFDCFVAGTIPVYWGASDVEQHIPAACFIDMRQFRDYQELRTFLKSLSPAAIRAYKEAGREFMNSPRFIPFKKQTFTELLGRIVEQDTGLSLGVA
jgi:hypothetical protein